uniref:Transposase MuDR plant domain-containing protein n=1 Tax=Cannabis sativa TaxID=3483 RepID=A0A803QCD7_CANSA
MTRIVIYVQYNGEWKDEHGSYKWSPKNKEGISIIVDDSSTTFEMLLDKLYKKIGANQNDIELKISYLSVTLGENMTPLILRGDECLAAYLLGCGENNCRTALPVELIKKDRGEKDIESCTKEIEQPLVDNYIDREFYFEENVCDIASTPRESGVNLDCEFSDHLNKSTTGSFPTPNHSQEELMTENHIDPFDYLLEHSDQQNQLISEDIFSFTDGSNLAIGQEFKNKDEVKFTLKNIAMKAFFQMNAKSTKSLYVTKCIDKSCKWAVRVAKVSNSERFSIRTYCNTHTCSLISRKRKHRQASAKVVANVVRSSFDGQKETLKPKVIMTIMQNNHMGITY